MVGKVSASRSVVIRRTEGKKPLSALIVPSPSSISSFLCNQPQVFDILPSAILPFLLVGTYVKERDNNRMKGGETGVVFWSKV